MTTLFPIHQLAGSQVTHQPTHIAGSFGAESVTMWTCLNLCSLVQHLAWENRHYCLSLKHYFKAQVLPPFWGAGATFSSARSWGLGVGECSPREMTRIFIRLWNTAWHFWVGSLPCSLSWHLHCKVPYFSSYWKGWGWGHSLVLGGQLRVERSLSHGLPVSHTRGGPRYTALPAQIHTCLTPSLVLFFQLPLPGGLQWLWGCSGVGGVAYLATLLFPSPFN